MREFERSLAKCCRRSQRCQFAKNSSFDLRPEFLNVGDKARQKCRGFGAKKTGDLGLGIWYNIACRLRETFLYYEKMREASSAVEKWEWFKDFIIGDWTEPASVYRLNTLPSENNWAGEEMRKEIIQKLDWYGYVTVGWSCLGHTRARWQTDSVCDWVKREHPEWKVVNNEFDCTITKKQSKKA